MDEESYALRSIFAIATSTGILDGLLGKREDDTIELIDPGNFPDKVIIKKESIAVMGLRVDCEKSFIPIILTAVTAKAAYRVTTTRFFMILRFWRILGVCGGLEGIHRQLCCRKVRVQPKNLINSDDEGGLARFDVAGRWSEYISIDHDAKLVV